MANKPCVIVCERKGTWAASLRRHLPREVSLRETRGLTDCLAVLADSGGSLVVIELGDVNLERALDALTEVGRRFPESLVVAVAPRGWESQQWLLREAGAAHFTTSPRDGEVLARLALRHFARTSVPSMSFAARIWDSLPWSEAAVR